MARILYLHGSKAGPFGSKTDFLERHGHKIVGRPRLPYPDLPKFSWRWQSAYFNQRWFEDAVDSAQECAVACRPEVIVGSSMGGAVAMNLLPSVTPQVLIAPAWKAWSLLRFGQACQVQPATVLIHGDQDRMIFRRYSRRLLARGRAEPEQAEQVANLERGLAERLADRPEYALEGRLVLVRGEGHRCNGGPALRALLTGVEVLIRE